MGFSWSSYVAQNTLLHRCYAAGFDEASVLADDLDAPLHLDQTFSLATDDVMILTRGDRDLGTRTAAKLDAALAEGGIVRSEEKDVTTEISEGGVTCTGVDVCSGIYLAPQRKKVASLFNGVLAFAQQTERLISPNGLAALLGHFSWFAQLSRPMYSCFDHVYEFARRTLPEAPQRLPDTCLAECLWFLALMPLLEAGLQREWSSTLLATDASIAYGFGVSAASVFRSRENCRATCRFYRRLRTP